MGQCTLKDFWYDVDPINLAHPNCRRSGAKTPLTVLLVGLSPWSTQRYYNDSAISWGLVASINPGGQMNGFKPTGKLSVITAVSLIIKHGVVFQGSYFVHLDIHRRHKASFFLSHILLFILGPPYSTSSVFKITE